MRKIIYLFLSFLVSSTQAFGSQEDMKTLQKADSLFKNRQYVQAFDNYEILMNQEGVTSESVLLKMAYISEGLEHFDQALYYLNLYYKINPSVRVLEKLSSLAEKKKLGGYDISDNTLFRNFLYQHGKTIEFIGFVLISIFVLILFWMKKKQKKRAINFASILCLGVLFLLLLEANWLNKITYGIVINQEGYVMKAPSSGSDVLEKLSAGSRVELAGKEDVWYKVSFNEGTNGYLRDSNLRTVTY